MKTIDYKTTSAMLVDHPHIRVTAIRYRLHRVFEDRANAAASLSPEMLALIQQWHRLQALEAQQAAKGTRRTDRRVAVSGRSERTARRREAISCPVEHSHSA